MRSSTCGYCTCERENTQRRASAHNGTQRCRVALRALRTDEQQHYIASQKNMQLYSQAQLWQVDGFNKNSITAELSKILAARL